MERDQTFAVDSQKFEVIKSIEGFVGENGSPTLLRPVNECWQPSDFLPDPWVMTLRDSTVHSASRAPQLSRSTCSSFSSAT